MVSLTSEMAAKLEYLSGLDARADFLVNELRQLDERRRELLAAWELELRLVDHLANVQPHDENVYIRFMQGRINCNKRFPQQLKELDRTSLRLSEKMIDIKMRIMNCKQYIFGS